LILEYPFDRHFGHHRFVEHKELGKSGVYLPEIGLGTWQYAGGVEPLRKGIEYGAFFLDTAESYGSEEVVGQALRGIAARTFIATKVSPPHLKRVDLLRSAEQSLHRLQRDYIDLYQLHGPNPRIPIEETMTAMEELVDAGKVRFIGVSNFTVRELRRAEAVMRKYPIVSNQVRFSLVDRTIERELLPYCQKKGISILAFSPLARAIQNILRKDRHGVLRQIVNETGKTEAQIALNWCTARDFVIAITKSDSSNRVIDACNSSGWRLTTEHIRLLDEAIKYRRRGPTEIALRRVARRVLSRLGR
jgi:diketogulonate reductase-like aldo/keto reductase